MKRSLISIIAIIIVLCFSNAFAGTKTFIKEYTYRASEADSKLSCRTISFAQAQRLLLEELGVYLESYSEVKNFQLSTDKIIAITAGIVRTEKLAEKWDGKKYWLRAKITVEPDKIIQQLNTIRQDRQKTRELEELREKLVFYMKENEQLRKAQKEPEGKTKKFRKKYASNINSITAINYIEQGHSLLLEFDYERALLSFNNGIKLSPNDDKAYSGRAFAYVQMGKYEEAIKDCDKAIEINPQNRFSYFVKGYAYQLMDKPSKAIEYFDVLIGMDPNEPLLYGFRGFLLGSIGNKDRANADFEKALEFGPQNSIVYFYRGLYFCLIVKDYKAAISDFKEAVRLDSNNSIALWGLGFSYVYLKSYKEAIENLNSAIELKPMMGVAYSTRGYAYEEMKEYDQALKDYSKAIELIPERSKGSDLAYRGRASILYFHKKMYKEAIEAYTKLLNLYPNDDLSYWCRGTANFIVGDETRGINDYKKACELGRKAACNDLIRMQSKKTRRSPLTVKEGIVSSNNKLRIYQPGDYINYKLTGFVNVSGIDVPIFGTVRYEVLHDMLIDYRGNQCGVYRMTFDYMASGKDASLPVKMYVDRYFTQGADGSMFFHGKYDSISGKQKYVKTPSNGKYVGIKSPFNTHESYSENIIYADGTSSNTTSIALGEETITCPAGNYCSIKNVTNTIQSDLNSKTTKTMEIYWLVPSIGPVRVNIEDYSNRNKFILEMMETNINYKDEANHRATSSIVDFQQPSQITHAAADRKRNFLDLVNGKVKGFRFFEYKAGEFPPYMDRVYQNIFKKITTRSIGWELVLEHPAPNQRIDFQIMSVWYGPSGEFFRHTLNSYILEQGRDTIHSSGYGWKYALPFGKWSTGNYRVDLYVSGDKIASGHYTIHWF